MALALTQFLQKNNKIAELCFLYLGAAMGYSRMYLGQHNLLDVSIGGLIALTFLHTSIWIFNNWQGKVAKTQ
jgi:membrane-associated phospholipid phosphatase